MHYFTWKSLVRGGSLKVYQTLEIHFVFDNFALGESMTGTGEDRYPLADKMSNSWVAFARTNVKQLPKWQA